MSTPVTKSVLEVIRLQFAEDDQGEAVRLVEERCGANLPLMTNDSTSKALERIQLAVLKLGAGRLQDLKGAIETAQRDWRDALVFAGFGDDIHAHLAWLRSVQGLDSTS